MEQLNDVRTNNNNMVININLNNTMSDNQLLRAVGIPMRGNRIRFDGGITIPATGEVVTNRRQLLNRLRTLPQRGGFGFTRDDPPPPPPRANITVESIVPNVRTLGDNLVDVRTTVNESNILEGGESVSYSFSSPEQVRDLLERFLPRLQSRAGSRYMINAGTTNYLLSKNNYAEILKTLTSFNEITEVVGSDKVIIDAILKGERITITKFIDPTEPVSYRRLAGQYYPYIHKYEDPLMIETLARLGCWSEVVSENYNDNCLLLALKDCGVKDSILEDLKKNFVCKKISKNKLKPIAEKYNLYITLRCNLEESVDKKGKYGNPNDYRCDLALLNEHYIHNFRTCITKFALQNYHAIKDKPEWWSYVSFKKKDKRPEKCMMAFDLLNTIEKTPIDICEDGIDATPYYSKVCKRTFTNLNYTEGVVREGTHSKDWKPKENDIDHNIFLDTEPVPYGVHEPFCVVYSEAKEMTNHVHTGYWCIQNALNEIADTYGVRPDVWKETYGIDMMAPPITLAMAGLKAPTVKLLAHNITYDAGHIMRQLYQLKFLERGTSIISGQGWYTSTTTGARLKIVFQDTYKMISMPLKDFGDAFKLDVEKEIMPYNLYTPEVVKQSRGVVSHKYLIDNVSSDIIEPLLYNLKRWGCECNGNCWDMIKYASIYCKMDVVVLKKGFKVFRNAVLEKFNMDCYAYCTISSLTDDYLTGQGVYDDVFEVSGKVRQFIANCCIGGRVMCANNKKIKVYGKIADYDGVSLYPSSMDRIPGYLKGEPKVWEKSINLQDVDGYFLKIKVIRVRKRYKFPITCIKNEDGGNEWTNDIEGQELFVDKFTLEDLIKYHKISYEIIQGYYYEDGRNDKINSVIRYMFNERKRYKREGNPLQLVLKLMMNAGYGKTGLKPVETEIRYVNKGNDAYRFMRNNFNYIKEYTIMPNGQYRFELIKQICEHFNRQHVACEILSVSKNIMNEVMCLAEDNDINIYYTDTDSMHMDYDQVDKLRKLFEEKYGRELNGEDLGQFHTDFGNIGGDKKSKVWAEESIFLSKKTYIDKLVDEEGNSGFHIRMKGIPSNCINHKAKYMFEENPMKMYEYLFNGNELCYNLNTGGNCTFKTNKNHLVSTVDNMYRTVSF